jgi:type IV pilus assembly protein PilB
LTLIKENIPNSIIQLITAEQAFYYNIVPFNLEDENLSCYSNEEASQDTLNEFKVIFDVKKVIIKTIPDETFQELRSRYYRISNQNTKKRTLHYNNDFLEQIIIAAKSIGSSDIHFEPYENECRVRFRLDGKLLEQYSITISEYPIIANKIKIKAGLDIAERRLPQDGRITMHNDYSEFDIRVSSLPTLHGEKIVLRLLNKDAGDINLDVLGFSSQELTLFKEYLKTPQGLILISGPTGSGKTTTLYAALKLLNKPKHNILTIEDPIEYTLEGINQVQLKEAIGLNFASALRSFLRQDPDIIMVGEIRDVETANMAIRASLTGHLVLSTIHTNSAWATISRLIDMGIPSFLIASTLKMTIAQRLVRKLCESCKVEQDIKFLSFPSSYEKSKNLHAIYKSVGCQDCHYTGYNGRVAIYEIIPITKELVEKIKSNSLDINDYLAEHKIPTLKSNAERLLQSGVTTLDEVYTFLNN